MQVLFQAPSFHYEELPIFHREELRKLNHFAVYCQESKKKVLSVDYTSEDEEYEYVAETTVKEQVNALASRCHTNNVFATLLVNGKQEKFQLDSAPSVNIMSDETVIKLCGQDWLSDLEETPVTLVMYNQSEVKPLAWARSDSKSSTPRTIRKTASSSSCSW